MIAIIKYNAGNISSVQNALTRLGYESAITDNETSILAADKVIFPGVGEASSAMKYLIEKKLDKTILKINKPMLGICLGQQLMCAYSDEGNTKCLGIFDSHVKKFPNTELVPHMSRNNFSKIEGVLFKGMESTNNVYFVHSYYAEVNKQTTAVCEYIKPFSAAMQKDNFYATQFHPEKSADIGEKILQNFLDL